MLQNTRTEAELNDPAYNYFLAFKIDPKETNPINISNIIKKALNSTRGGIVARRLLELKNDILETMCNDAVYNPLLHTYRPNAGARAQEASAAKKLLLGKVVDAIVSITTLDKIITKSKLTEICVHNNTPYTYFSIDELCQALLRLGIKIVENTSVSIPVEKFIKSQELLHILKKRTLYDFLECPRTASQIEIKAKNTDIARDTVNLTDLKKKQIYRDLCALVDELLLSTSEIKMFYNIFLALKDNIVAEIQDLHDIGIKEIPDKIYLSIVTRSSVLADSAQNAPVFVDAVFKFYQIKVPVTPPVTVAPPAATAHTTASAPTVRAATPAVPATPVGVTKPIAPAAPVETLPYMKYKKAEQTLSTFSKQDLYDFLGCSRAATCQDIKNRSDSLYISSQQGNDLRKKQLVSSLCALVKELLLSSEATRRNYDIYLLLRNDIEQSIAKRAAAGITEISEREYKLLLDRWTAQLRDETAAKTHLQSACKYYKISIQP